MQEQTGREIIQFFPHTSLATRLARELGDLPREISLNPASYLRTAVFPDGINSWLPFSLAKNFLEELALFFKHPIQAIKGILSHDAMLFGFINPPTYAVEEFSTDVILGEKKKIRRSPWLRPLLATSAVFHLAFISYLVYIWVMGIIAPFSNVRIVSKGYRNYDEKLVAVVPQKQKINAQSLDKTLTLEEIRKRDQKRREEEERRKREEEERKKREEEARKKQEEEDRAKADQIAKEKAEQEAKDKAAAEDKPKPKSIELNETAIKDIVGKVYTLYNAGFVKIDVKNMLLTLTFKIDEDGSVSNIKVAKSSGNNYVDRQAKEVLWTLGESHIFGAAPKLSSTSITLELTENHSILSIVGFAPTPDEANNTAKGLNGLLWFLRTAKKNSSAEMTELLSHMKVRSTGNRVEANLTISSDRAGELLKNKFATQQPNSN